MKIVKDTKERHIGKKNHKCRICGETGTFDSYLVREMMNNTRDEFEYFVCPACHCLQIGEIPDNLGDYYSGSYYSYEFKANTKAKFENEIVQDAKILDVGCGSGEWLFSMAEQGWTNLFGCDPFISQDISYGDRVKIRNCSIHEIDGEGSFELIRMSDSFEHVTDPNEVLASASKLIKDDGVIMMSVPTFPNIAFDIFGTHWYQLDAPRHICIPSLLSIDVLAGKNGLHIDSYEYDSNENQFIRSFFYQHGVPYTDIDGKLIYSYFSDEDINNLRQKSIEANTNERGDHVQITLSKDLRLSKRA